MEPAERNRTTSSIFRASETKEDHVRRVTRKRKLSPTNSSEGARRGHESRRCRTLQSNGGRRRVSQVIADPASSGDFSGLPIEVLEQILLGCDAPALAQMGACSRFFSVSGIIDRVAQILVRRTAVGKILKLQAGETWAALLQFITATAEAQIQARKMSLGSYHSAVVLQSTASPTPALHTFGRGFHGQLGHQGYENSDVPLPVAMEAPKEKKNYKGSSRRNSTSPSSSKNTTTSAPTIFVSCGSSHCAALTSEGNLLTWGLASSGELGHGGWTPIEVDMPRPVTSIGDRKIVTVATGANHTLAISACGAVWSCGRGRHGQLGQGHFHDVGPLQRVEALHGARVVHASAGAGHSLVLCDNHQVWAWGDNRFGQIGLGDRGADGGLPWPHRVETPQGSSAQHHVTQIAAGGNHTLFVTTSGGLLVCGRGRHGALGLGDNSSRRTPHKVEPGAGSAQFPNSMLVDSLGNAMRGGTAGPCARCTTGHCRVVQAAAGGNHSAVITACGEVRTTGSNCYGQLGHGDTKACMWFTRVEALSRPQVGVRALALGDDHSAAVGEGGKLYFWGRGDWGQLGSSDTRSCWTPQPLADACLAPNLPAIELD